MLIKGGSDRLKFGGGPRLKVVRSIFQGGPDTLEDAGINTDNPSLGNFDTEKFVSEWIESADTLKQLNGHN